jgi:hypothetical protein
MANAVVRGFALVVKPWINVSTLVASLVIEGRHSVFKPTGKTICKPALVRCGKSDRMMKAAATVRRCVGITSTKKMLCAKCVTDWEYVVRQRHHVAVQVRWVRHGKWSCREAESVPSFRGLLIEGTTDGQCEQVEWKTCE